MTHTFELGNADFLLDGRPFQIRAGELHPSRIPHEYWRHRIRMAKAIGLNAISSYVFWNYHEAAEGVFDFKTGNHDLRGFAELIAEEGMWWLLRPGPYCCGEWDLGGLPCWLLRHPDVRLRCQDPWYTQAAERYCRALADEMRSYQVTEGGPILMLQIENEYGSYANDRRHLQWLSQLWRSLGMRVPFYTADGAVPSMLEAGTLPGSAVGLDPGLQAEQWELAQKMNPGVPVFSSETYPGWLTHWGEPMALSQDLSELLRFYMETRRSFSLYMFHGGTNFGFTAGANTGAVDGAKAEMSTAFLPTITTYDYAAPVNEQGRPTAAYTAMRNLMAAYAPTGKPLPRVPEPISAQEIPAVPLVRWTSVWEQLPTPIPMVQPQPFEMLGQNQGLMLYRTRLIGHKDGTLFLRELHDYAIVYVDGHLIGTIDRRLGSNSIELPKANSPVPVLDILVEGMGHVNFAEYMVDRKGITERAVLNTMTLMNWEVFPLPLAEDWVTTLCQTSSVSAEQKDKPGVFFRGEFILATMADTYLDLSGYQKGYVWVNGHNLGRYWNIGPQQRLFCPAPWLRQGMNSIMVLDLLQTEADMVCGKETLFG